MKIMKDNEIALVKEILKKLGIEEGYLLGEYARKPRKKHK